MRAVLVELPPEGGRGPTIDLDKAWHGIHFLLTGDPWGGRAPWSDVLLGGTPDGPDNGYGPPRRLSPEQVQAIAAALAGLPRDRFEDRYDGDELATADIYPDIWDDPTAREYLVEHYVVLRAFYEGAANRGSGVRIELV